MVTAAQLIHQWLKAGDFDARQRYKLHTLLSHHRTARYCHATQPVQQNAITVQELYAATHSATLQRLLHCVTQHAHYQGALLLSAHPTVARCTRRCNFIHAHKKSAAFPAPIFMKFTNAQQLYVQISYSEFHTNGTVLRKERGDFHLRPQVTCGCHRTEFHETRQKICDGMPYTHFYLNERKKHAGSAGRIAFSPLRKSVA